MKGLVDLLAEHPFFQGLKREHLEYIATCGTNAVFKPGEYLAREGEAADRFYVLRHGTVALELFVPHRGAIVIQTIREGDVLGWSWLLEPHRWAFDARAVTLVRAIAFDGACLRRKCEEDPELGYEIMKRFARVIAERLKATRIQLMDVYGNRR